MSKVDEAYERLIRFTNALSNVLHGRLAPIRRALDGEVELPDNCPSRASLADMEASSIREKLIEVNAAAEDLQKAIWEEGKDSA